MRIRTKGMKKRNNEAKYNGMALPFPRCNPPAMRLKPPEVHATIHEGTSDRTGDSELPVALGILMAVLIIIGIAY
jgi:hypothetical protein